MPESDSGRPTIAEARQVMRRQWGYESFRPGQEEVLRALLDGHDVLGVLPTGGGKSLCYQIPALLTEGLVLVVSPLIALMQDQVEGLQAKGVDATFLNSTLPKHEVEQRWTDAEHGRYDLLYMAPERMTTDVFRARAERLDVSLLAVDEAHCVSEWGHHFRPAYLEIPEGRALVGDPPTIAVTATATPAVRSDIVELLDVPEAEEVVRGFDRPNLVWSVFQGDQKWAKLRDVVEGVEGSGIVYTATRRGVKRWARRLHKEGVSVTGYHGQMDADTREEQQQAWVNDEVRVMVATNAFGMGIDKPDVRFVVHADVPSSLEAYYQEAGRAGRDGRRAYAVLLFQEPDADTQEALIESSHPTAAEVRAVYDAVCNVGQVPVGAEPDGPVVVNRNAVQKITGDSRSKVRTAVDLLEREGAWTQLSRRTHYGLIRFRTGVGDIRRYAEGCDNQALAAFVRTLLRQVHADAFSEWWPLDVRSLSDRMDLSRERLDRGLSYLADRGFLQWQPPGDALQVELEFARARKLPIDDRAVQRARERAETRLSYMLRYARAVTCRRHFLLTYFGEESPETCGACDVCLGRHEETTVTPDTEPVLRAILERVRTDVPRDEWFEADEVPRPKVEALLNWLVERGYLEMDSPLDGTFQLTSQGREQLDADGPTESTTNSAGA